MRRLAMLPLLAALLAASPLHAAGVNIGSSDGIAGVRAAAATVVSASGPSSGIVSTASTNFTVTLTGATFSGAQTVTIADGAQSGTFTPSVGSPATSTVVVTPAAAATGFTFTYTPASTGAKTLTFTNAQGWTNPAPLTYTSNAAPVLAASGPSSGVVSTASTNFTVTLTGATFSGAQTVTIADGAQSGTFTPSVGSPATSTVVVTPAAAATGFTFTYTPASTGAKTLTFTNAQGWTNPAPLTYTASAAAGCAAATAFLARTSGLSTTESDAYNAMICGMIADGVGCSAWSGSTGNLDALYIFATNTTTTANLNLCSTSFGLTGVSTAPTFSADHGYTGAGGCLSTNFTPSTAAGNYTQNSASIGIYVTSSRAVNQTWNDIGVTLGATTQMFPMFGGQFSYNINSSTSVAPTNTNAQGSWHASRTASNATALYKNEVSFNTGAPVSAALPTGAIYILARDNGSCNNPTSDSLAAAWIGGGVAATPAAAIQHRINGYMTALGINVY